jgi:catalase
MADRQEYTHPNDDFVQAGALYRDVMTDTDREHLVGNIATHLKDAQERIQYRQCAIFYKANEDYGSRIANALGLDKDRVRSLAAMTNDERWAATAK